MVYKIPRSAFDALKSSRQKAGFWKICAEVSILLITILFLEFVGQYLTSDLQDFTLIACMAPLITLLIVFGGKKSVYLLPFLKSSIKGGAARLRSLFQIEIGADFRCLETETLPGCAPYHDLKRILVLSLLFAMLVIPFHSIFPDGFRALQDYVFYTPYLFAMVCFWALLCTVIFIDIIITAVLFYHYVLKSPYFNPKTHARGPSFLKRIRTGRFSILVSLVLLFVTLEIFYGKTGWFWLMSLTAILSFSLAFIPRANETVGLLIKRPTKSSLLSISISEWNFTFYSVVQIFGLGLFVVATGAGWFVDPGSSDNLVMPCTHFLGRIFGMFTSMATLFYLFATVDFLDFKRLRSDPSLSRGKVFLHEENSLPVDIDIKEWKIRSLAHIPERDEGDLYYNPSLSAGQNPGVPLFKKNLLRINPHERLFYLDRRDFISKRRTFFRGLKLLLKICHASTFKDGSGFILIPHCYFVEGLHRDDQNEQIEEDRVIGPDFHSLWGIRVRHFLFKVLETMDIDIVFFEDGITYNELHSVFEIIFELYQGCGDRFRAEDYHFKGIVGVRVMVETIRPDMQRNKEEGYPETHYTNLSHARILQIFKDRGGREELAPDNAPSTNVDIPAFF